VFTLSPDGPLLANIAKGIVQDMVNLDYVSFFLITGYKTCTDMSRSVLIVPELRVSH